MLKFNLLFRRRPTSLAENVPTFFLVKVVCPAGVCLDGLTRVERNLTCERGATPAPVLGGEQRLLFLQVEGGLSMGIKKETKVRDLDIIKPGNNFLVLVKRSLDEVFTLKTYQVQYILIFNVTCRRECTSATSQFRLKQLFTHIKSKDVDFQ